MGMAVELLHLGVNSQVERYVRNSFEMLSSLKHDHSLGGVMGKVISELHELACASRRCDIERTKS